MSDKLVGVQISPPAPDIDIIKMSGSSSVVECLLAKEEVASSNLVFRSTRDPGDVAKWQGGGLQNPYSAVRVRSSPLR